MNNDLIVSAIANAILLVIAIAALKVMLSWTMARIKELVDEFKTEFRTCIAKLEDEDKELWKELNNHGHAGLTGNGNRVTR